MALDSIRDTLDPSEWVNTTVCTASRESYCDQVASTTPGAYCRVYSTIPESEFYYAFNSYLAGLGGLSADNFICCRANDTNCENQISCFDVATEFPTTNPDRSSHSADFQLFALRTSVTLLKQKTVDDFVDAIKSTREYMDACNLLPNPTLTNSVEGQDISDTGSRWTFITGYTFKYYAQYLHSHHDLYTTCGWILLGIFFTVFLFQVSLRNSLITCVVILSVMMEIAGVISELPDCKLNAFSIVNLCIGLGMAVEFTAHICHYFMTVDGATKDARVVRALGFMGPPMVHGAVTSMIAAAFLVTSEVAFIRTYYFGMFFLLVVVAFLNGIVLLPVLLSLFGDTTMKVPERGDQTQDTMHGSVVMNPAKDTEAFGF